LAESSDSTPRSDRSCPWAQLHNIIEGLRQAVAGFVESRNTHWLNGRLHHLTAKEAYQDATTTRSSMIR
jgi:hypothetical protein